MKLSPSFTKNARHSTFLCRLQEEESVRQKLQMEKIHFDKEVKSLKESRDLIDSNLAKVG